MNRLITAAALSSLLVLGGPAEAAKKKKKPAPAKVYNATFASSTGAYGAVTGKAQLVDNKRRDTATIQLKGLLQPGAVYDWVIYKVNGVKPACSPGGAGQGVEAFNYKPLTVNASGNASSTAKSKKFVAYTTTRYAVVVRNEEGSDIVCAEFKRKKKPAPSAGLVP